MAISSTDITNFNPGPICRQEITWQFLVLTLNMKKENSISIS